MDKEKGNHARDEVDCCKLLPPIDRQDHERYASLFLMEEDNMIHDSATPNSSLFLLYPTMTFNSIHSKRNGRIKWGQVVM